jgi:hypothetical protein
MILSLALIAAEDVIPSTKNSFDFPNDLTP